LNYISNPISNKKRQTLRTDGQLIFNIIEIFTSRANTKSNNPKSLAKNRFSKSNPPKYDKDCKLGVHSASNAYNNKKYEFYWGIKSCSN
jgi:hypothetical protein